MLESVQWRQALVERHGGEVPNTFEELEQLAGVGHKTASVVMSVAFQVDRLHTSSLCR